MCERKLGLALGSGGAKGFAHIGVLAALTDYGIPVHAVAGSSMGGLVGAVYAMGTSPRMLRGLAISLKRRHWLDFTVPKMGLIQGARVEQLIGLLTRNGTFDDTVIPLAVVATDLIRRQLVVFRSGNIAQAVRASISIPGVFVPVVRDGAVYVDGGVLQRVPVAAAWELGCDVVLGVDVGVTPVGTVPKSIMDVIMQSLEMMQEQVCGEVNSGSSLTITPEVTHIGTGQFTRAAEAIEIGYAATVERIDEIKRLLQPVQSLG
ncbi:patatin-like phospholipase family protein [Alicyclobacillus acidoterrestris]|uniref:Patatin-like phospholipase family protein n=1 Tax=Alicyclobacillus acidoterrestris (strain ATCC 49025 / DSM 3922 / CIP 106132 / NCIMB 13137 / GD3B) TaxID=1356854 RepID=T0CFJ3_ALIAG|nr:patatin-like phospholipase family protein [Alicyclobacillus acidoterrestris]EPZ51579.1 hypothetical protein N007_03195 [Alicyclobacillus acidoterrestris ATCC 49025]UNO50637.1 patatin-like phospholipase family protein [Alicyclobacillus acidoterrestris]